MKAMRVKRMKEGRNEGKTKLKKNEIKGRKEQGKLPRKLLGG